MKTPEIKVGQKYRVVDEDGFSCPFETKTGDFLQIAFCSDNESQSWRAYNLSRDCDNPSIIFYMEDIEAGHVQLISEPTVDTQDIPSMSGQDDAEKLSEGSVGTLDGIFKASHTCLGIHRNVADENAEGIRMYRNGELMGNTSGVSAEILYQFIEGSGKYNQHNQLELHEMSLDQLKDVVRILERYIENHVDTTASCLDIRLTYNGDHIGGWGASVHQLNYWSAGEHPSGHLDKLLFSVEKVIGI